MTVLIELKQENNGRKSTKKAVDEVTYGKYKVNIELVDSDIEKFNSIQNSVELNKDDSQRLKSAICKLQKIKEIMTDGQVSIRTGIEDWQITGGNVSVSGLFAVSNKRIQYLSGNDKLNSLLDKTLYSSIKYFSCIGKRLLVLDYTDLGDAIASYYTVNEIPMEPRDVEIWLRNDSVFSVCSPDTLLEMAREMNELPERGQLFEIARQFRISNSPMMHVGGKYMFTYIYNNKVDMGSGRYSYYADVIDATVMEIWSMALDYVASLKKNSISFMGMNDTLQACISVSDDMDIDELRDRLSMLIRLFGRRYIFEPRIYEYNVIDDAFVLR